MLWFISPYFNKDKKQQKMRVNKQICSISFLPDRRGKCFKFRFVLKTIRVD